MSKFLTQSKAFLPMVMQKSTTDAIQILEKFPSLSTAQHDLPKLETQTQDETRKEEKQNKEPLDIEPLNKEIIKQINSAPKDTLNIVLNKTLEVPKIDSNKVIEACKVTLSGDTSKSPESLKVVAVNASKQNTLLRALIMDLIQIQKKLVVILAASRVWLWQKYMGSGATTSVHVVQSNPILSLVLKKRDEKSKNKESDEESIYANSKLLEVVKEKSPAWQKSISNQLGEFQKIVVERLLK